MEEARTTSPKALTVVVTIAGAAAIVTAAYRLDRAYGRWLTRMNPLTRPRERLGELKTGYRGRRADVSDLAEVFFGVLEDVDRARGRSSSA